MPSFTKEVTTVAGGDQTLERVTDDPAEMTALRYSGWEEKPAPKKPEEPAEGAPAREVVLTARQVADAPAAGKPAAETKPAPSGKPAPRPEPGPAGDKA